MSDSPEQALVEAGRFLFSRGWVPATSGNFSARRDDGTIAITVSGRHKGRLTVNDLMTVEADGTPLQPGLRSSAETGLHLALYRRWPAVGAVLHTHSVNATVLTRVRSEALYLADYELLKAFPGVTTHEGAITVPIFPNDQDIKRLSAQVEEHLDRHSDVHGYLIAGHGLYTWGRDVAETLRHVEAFEFLFECEWKTLCLK
ncbi:methylthioribulose 1-phosphate dehydratase [Endothiovibrio diazotrophicus]